MEGAWTNASDPHVLFWKRLQNQNVDQLLESPELLRHMRYDHKLVKRHLKHFGSVFKERGLNLYELIARACGDVWDEEDEEKSAPLGVKENAVSLDCSREIGLRQDQGQGRYLPRRNGPGEKILQKEGSCCGGSPQKAPTKKKKQE